MPNNNKLLLLTLIILFFSPTAYADERILALIDQDRINLAPYIHILEDPNGDLSISDITSAKYQARFNALKNKNFILEKINSAYWLKLQFFGNDFNTKKPSNWVVLLERHPSFGNVEYYEVIDSDEFREVKTGRSMPFYTRDAEHPQFAFNVTVPPKLIHRSKLIINSPARIL